MSDPDFIVPPPGLVPDVPASDRRSEAGGAEQAEGAVRAEGTVRAERALPGFRPPPGIRPPSALPIAPPAALPIAPPSTPPTAPAQAEPPARPAPTGPWRLRSADGIEFPVRDRVVAGRDPSPPAWLQGAVVVAVPDHTRSMSKTHALLESRGGRLLVTDLDSTNGVRVWPEGEEPVDLEPGVPAEAPLDAVILLGDVAFLVERAPTQSV
ncbi:FHA domain-containing protein [Agromyces bracchium]|uniref:FHA domain-containing protein n=1 Tax=Agromyces bracchium TaxID=88376 RepID=A0A6I3M7N9_9MICO|nr:FHA domain-containing protein [Agromyces bracchium]MTH69255.1 FHA domain-containing protein [Agromyces bracchium]